MEPIILASESPRRQEFFRLLGLPFTCMPANIDESFAPGADCRAVAEELAVKKVSTIAETMKDAWICGADTLVELDGIIYGKASDRGEAGKTLRSLRGRTHRVVSAVALYNFRAKTMDCRTVTSEVSFAPLSEGEIEWYLDSGEWAGAAGAYKIQGLAACFITGIIGSHFCVAGLPIREFYVMLRDNGYRYGG
ncbi:MAG: Maf family protein [Treponema sp.]|jgi:septum formation protein|nr:Maf family protein [Treponema sp.]